MSGSTTPRPRMDAPAPERRDPRSTRAAILSAARASLLEDGYARLSTRRVAELANVPLSQIHYHYGSKQELILAVLAAENERLLARQATMFESEAPLWRQWEQACDYLDEDLASGYVRVLLEMVAAGWTDPQVAGPVREQLSGWFRLLRDVADRAHERLGGLGPFTADELSALMGVPFLGAEAAILLGFDEADLPARSALRKIGDVLRRLETNAT